jgi:ribosomal-protein-serine acetyltransferase
MKQKVIPQVITSARISMRPHRSGDEILLNKSVLDSFDQLHEWMDWAIAPQSIEETKAYIEFSQKCWSEECPEELPLLIFDAKAKKLIGASGFNAINWKVPAFEIGYWVNIHYAGQGLITQAVNILTQYAFSRWNAKRIEIRCDPENAKSAAIPKRLGFLLEAHFKNHRVQPVSKKLSGTLVFVRYGPEGLPKVEYQLRDADRTGCEI